MKLNDFLATYNLVQEPTFEPEIPDNSYVFDPFERLSSFNASKKTSTPTVELPTEKPYSWTDGFVGVEPTTFELKDDDSNIVASKNDIIKFFRNKGLTEVLARGIYGNIMQESAGKLNAVSRDGHNSYGIAQWTGIRRTRLHSRYGLKPTLNLQLEYIWEELNSSEKRALDDLRKQTTIKGATTSFMNKFERPHKDYANLNQRIKYAIQG